MSLFKVTATWPVQTLLSLVFLEGFLMPNMAYALSEAEATHLLGRTGFAPSYAEIKPYLPLNKTEAVQKRLDSVKTTAQTALPSNLKTPFSHSYKLKGLSPKEAKALKKEIRLEAKVLQVWWLNECVVTANPMAENLTLFWHNHFVSSARKVRLAPLMAQQNITLRQNALGNYKAFTLAMLHDPAMLKYLDNVRNKKGQPNENLARELLELFTLGEGSYSEQDVKEVARILTGYSFNYKTGEYLFQAKKHDDGVKTIFGQTGAWNVKDLVNIIFQQPTASKLITQKIWHHYIEAPIAKKELNTLSKNFAKDFELKPLVQSILNNPKFWAKAERGQKIKSPVQLTVGLARQFSLLGSGKALTHLTRLNNSLGQALFYPPNVKGWAGGDHWITIETLLKRKSFMSKMARGMTLNKAIWQNKLSPTQWQTLLLAEKPVGKINTETDEKTVKTSLKDLSYQLY